MLFCLSKIEFVWKGTYWEPHYYDEHLNARGWDKYRGWRGKYSLNSGNKEKNILFFQVVPIRGPIESHEINEKEANTESKVITQF